MSEANPEVEIREKIRERVDEAVEESGHDEEKAEDLLRREDWLGDWCPTVPFQGDMEPLCDAFDEVSRLVDEEGLEFDEALDMAFSDEDPEQESSGEGEDVDESEEANANE